MATRHTESELIDFIDLYLSGVSYQTLVDKYNIPAKSTVNDWINRYIKGKENGTYSPKPEVYTVSGTKKNI